MAHFATSLIVVGYALSAALGIRGLLRRKLTREAIVVATLALIAVAFALPVALGIDLPKPTTALDLFLRRLLPESLLKSLGFH